jgi:3-oxosteroid 1-dehydrogenase
VIAVFGSPAAKWRFRPSLKLTCAARRLFRVLHNEADNADIRQAQLRCPVLGKVVNVPTLNAEKQAAEWRIFDFVYDVVIVCSGLAAFSAALAAAARGSHVLMLEKADHIGGTTAKSNGTVWIPNNPFMRASGLVDERNAALRYLARVSYPLSYDSSKARLGLTKLQHELLEMLYDAGSDAFEHLMDLDALPYDSSASPLFPDYYAGLAENQAPFGRAIGTRRLPTEVVGVGHTGGSELIRRLHAASGLMGIDIRTGHAVHDVVRDSDGRVIGVESHVRGSSLFFGAKKAVIFGSGGFLHDKAKAKAFLPGPVFGGGAVESATGDFIDICSALGASLGNMDCAWWDQVAVGAALRNRSTSFEVFYPGADSMIMVNRYGRRVMNEKAPYNERGQVHFRWNPDKLLFDNLLLFMIFDDSAAHDRRNTRHPYPTPLSADSEADTLSAQSIPDLCEVIQSYLSEIAGHTGGFSLDSNFEQQLIDEISIFNRMAALGVDSQYGRGESPIDGVWGPVARSGAQRNAAMYPLAGEGPYHCIVLGAGALDTKGGPVTDAHGRVLGRSGEHIPGLYGVGNCVSSPTGRAYCGPGATLGVALTFGWVAGSHAGALPDSTPIL